MTASRRGASGSFVGFVEPLEGYWQIKINAF